MVPMDGTRSSSVLERRGLLCRGTPFSWYPWMVQGPVVSWNIEDCCVEGLHSHGSSVLEWRGLLCRGCSLSVVAGILECCRMPNKSFITKQT